MELGIVLIGDQDLRYVALRGHPEKDGAVGERELKVRERRHVGG
jgi:hypothetical protein